LAGNEVMTQMFNQTGAFHGPAAMAVRPERRAQAGPRP